MADLTFTTIEESAKSALGISRDEYALCNYIQVWSAHPANKMPGYCDRTRLQMANFVGITERGIMKMLDRMEAINLIQRYDEKRFLHRITEYWFETVTLAKLARKGEQSSPAGENKVPLNGEQSSPKRENKVPPHKEYSKDVYKDEINAAENSPLSPPFKKTDLVIEVHDGDAPGCRIVELLQVEESEKNKLTSTGGGEPRTKPERSGRVKMERAGPTIHPENEKAFDHFSDPVKARAAWVQWLEYKKLQFGDKYKTPQSELIKLRELYESTKGDSNRLQENISYSIGSLYKGIFPKRDGNGMAPKNGRSHINHASGNIKTNEVQKF